MIHTLSIHALFGRVCQKEELVPWYMPTSLVESDEGKTRKSRHL